MRNWIYSFIIVSIFAGAAYYFFNPFECKQPSELEMKRAAVRCAESLTTQDSTLPADACLALKGNKICIFTSDDEASLRTYILSKIVECAKKDLAKANFCIDKVDSL